MPMPDAYREAQTTISTFASDLSAIAAPECRREEDGFMVVDRPSTTSTRSPQLYLNANGDVVEALSTHDIQAQFAVSSIPRKVSPKDLAKPYADDLQTQCQCAEKSRTVLTAARSRHQIACAKFMEIARSAYTSTSDLHALVCQRTPKLTSAQADLDKAEQKAARQLALLDDQWQELCRAMQNLPQPDQGCDSAFDDVASAISESSSNAPADVNEYFRICQEIYVIKERISELTLDQAASVESTTNINGTSNAQYFEEKLMELNNAMANVQQEIDAQKEACLARGIDPERYRYRRLSSRHSKIDSVTEWLNRDHGT